MPARSYRPPPAVVAAAKRGLALLAEQYPSNRGGTSVGLATARLLASGRSISLAKVRHINRYFPRHEVDKKGEGWGVDSKGYQAWLLWGCDPARSWTSRVIRSADAK